MHKLKTGFIAISLMLLSLISCNCHAQLLVGTGTSYGTDIQQFALHTRVYYYPSERICFGPEFSYFPKTSENGISRQLTEYGLAFHYIFELNEKLGIYPLTSFNYSREVENSHQHTQLNTAFGIGFGAGLHASFGDFFPFIEGKYLTGNLAQASVNAGVIYRFEW